MNINDLLLINILKFQKQFFCGVNLSQLNFKELFEELSWEEQETFVNFTFNHPRILKYPIKISYQIAVLKKIIAELEHKGVEIHDSFYLSLSKLLRDNNSCNIFYKHYTLNESKEIITLQENSSFISEGTTGLCSWQASLALSEWCLQNKENLKNKSVLELGSGVGLLGITLILKCTPSKIWLSDCHSSVLNILCENIKLNFPEEFKNNEFQNKHLNDSSNIPTGTVLLSKQIGDTSTEVVSLLWEEIDSCSKFNQVIPDFIFAADVVYDSSIFIGLCKVFKFYFAINSRCTVILACTVRNSDTLNSFLKLLIEEHISVIKLSLVPQHHFVWSKESPIEILQLSFEK